MRHELPSGGWVEIKPVQELKGKDIDHYRHAVRTLIPRDADGAIDVQLSVALGLDPGELKRDAIIACLVTAWSFLTDGGDPLPVPSYDGQQIVNRESVGDYPADDAIALEAIIAPYQVKMDPPDPKGVTTSSSNGRSRATANTRKA